MLGDSAQFGATLLTDPNGLTSDPAFVAKLATNGVWEWAVSLGVQSQEEMV